MLVLRLMSINVDIWLCWCRHQKIDVDYVVLFGKWEKMEFGCQFVDYATLTRLEES